MMTVIRILALAVFCLPLPAYAQAASYTLTWTNNDGAVAESVRIERAPAQGSNCGVFAEIAAVTPTTATYVDPTAPTGQVCYRVYAASALYGNSEYSNLAGAPTPKKPANLKAR